MLNERQHIALTVAQIIAAEKGELQLEYRNGEKVCQVLWLKPQFMQDVSCLNTVCFDESIKKHKFNGEGKYTEYNDLFVSERQEKQAPEDRTKEFLKVVEFKNIEGIEYVVCKDVNNSTSCDECICL